MEWQDIQKTLDNICEKICVSRLTCNLRKVGTSKLLALLCNGDRNLAIVHYSVPQTYHFLLLTGTEYLGVNRKCSSSMSWRCAKICYDTDEICLICSKWSIHTKLALIFSNAQLKSIAYRFITIPLNIFSLCFFFMLRRPADFFEWACCWEDNYFL